MTTAVTSARPRRTGRPPGRRYADSGSAQAVTSVAYTDPPPRPRLGRRVSAFFHRHPRVRLAALLALPVAWLLGVYLGSLVVLLVASVLADGPVHVGGRAHVHARQLPHPVGARRLPERRLAHDPDGGDGHRRRRGARVPDRVLHGARRLAADARDLLIVAVADAAVGQLPREGLRVADDALRDAGASTGHSPRSGSPVPRLTETGLWLVFTYLWLPFMILPDLRRARADPEFAPGGVGGSRRAVAATRSSASSCRSRSRRSSPARSSRSR